MKLSLVLDVIAKGANQIRKMTGDVRDLSSRGMTPLAKATATVTRATEKADRETRKVSASTMRWMRIALRSADAVDRLAGRFKALGKAALLSGAWVGLKALEHGSVAASRGVTGLLRKMKDVALTTVSWGALGAGALFGWLTGGVISTASEFEGFQVALEGTEGSAKKAKAAMDWVAKFAKDTPYEMAEVTDAFVKARNAGIDPTTGAMTKLGDAAGATRKSLMDAVDALADAQTFEYERLKEFGITSSTKGNIVSFSYINKASKSTTKAVVKDAGKIRDAILGIFDEKYGGGMMRQSKTFEGIWNNIKDGFVGFQLRVANAGFFDVVKGKLQNVLDWMNKLAADGTLNKWAEKVSNWLTIVVNRAEDFVKGVDWAGLGREALTIGKAFWSIALAIARIVELWSKLPAGGATWIIPGLNTINPLQNGAPPSGSGRPLWDQAKDWWNAKPSAPVRATNPNTPVWQRGLKTGAPALRAPAGGGKSAAPRNDKVAVTIDLKGAPAGTRTRVAASDGVSVKTGYRGQSAGAPA